MSNTNMDDLFANVKKMVDSGNIPDDIKNMMKNIQNNNNSNSNTNSESPFNNISPEMLNNLGNMLNSNTEQLVDSEKNIEPPKIPYDNNMMNFTQQQDVGEISKDDNLFSLSGIRREKTNSSKGSLPYEKEQITCPKCGSAFVSTKRGQGIFGTSKVKYICEACKNKF